MKDNDRRPKPRKAKRQPLLSIHPNIILKAGELKLEADEIVVFLFLLDTQGKNRWSYWTQVKIGRSLGWPLVKGGTECRRVSKAVKALKKKTYIDVDKRKKTLPDGGYRTLVHYSTDPLIEKLGMVPRWKRGKPDPRLKMLLGQEVRMSVFLDRLYKLPEEVWSRLPTNFDLTRERVPISELQYLGLDPETLLEWLQESRRVEVEVAARAQPRKPFPAARRAPTPPSMPFPFSALFDLSFRRRRVVRDVPDDSDAEAHRGDARWHARAHRLHRYETGRGSGAAERLQPSTSRLRQFVRAASGHA